ncbi:hypothetical protein RAS12_13475 [Achromobacter seleniivolatilans]|uniref:RecT family protein n=1 Tax=Achromobacter seleniivolatilans TaxID=3047478 RepID=A0ABY9M8P2_9BURK|nr:hypothetical protein [Achromobacter sp. R39]WMD23336.1 hypothetical protein RAS12_13475 [Achromobacter sp. R39]
MTQTATIQNLRAAPEAQMPIVAPGFGSLQGFELMQRAARLLSSSTLVPVAYRQTIEKLDRFGNVKESRENPNALANSVVALNMAQRMGADPLMVMQNLYIVEGRPSWSSQWIIAAINGCGRFSPLRFRIENRGKRVVEYRSTFWENNQRQTKVDQVDIEDKVCVAWAIEKETGEIIESPAVSIEMAVKEGWYTKNGSKWQTMDEVMLRYRTASFFGKLYAPELLMGLQSVEEAQDIIEASTGSDGTISVNVDELRGSAAQTHRPATAAPADVTDVEARDPATQSAPSPAKEQAKADTPVQNVASSAPATKEDHADAQQAELPAADDDAGLDPAKVEHQIQSAKSIDVLDLASDSIEGVTDLGEQARLHQLYQARRLSLTAEQQQARPAGTTRRRMAAPE